MHETSDPPGAVSVERGDDVTVGSPYRCPATEASSLEAVPLNINEIDQSLLNIDKKERSNLFPWTGQFSPQLVEVLIEKYAAPGSFVLDPFAGSGTTLFECARKRLEAVAVEINPSACCMARAYELANCEKSERVRSIWEVGHILREFVCGGVPLFDASCRVGGPTPPLGGLKRVSAALSSSNARILFEALVVLLDLYKPDLDVTRVMTTWNRLVSTVQRLPYTDKRLRVIHSDARSTTLANGVIDLVITSPPYINVFNYHQQYRSSAEFLGWNLLTVARSEIGANRKHRVNRFLTVIQYCLDISDVLRELMRVCKPTAQIIIVVGRQSRIRGVPFYNGELVAQVATCSGGFGFRTRQERVFRNRFGEDIFEDILHFSVPSTPKVGILDPRGIAQYALEKALLRAPANIRSDIEEAIAQRNSVKPSQVYATPKGS